MVRSATATTLQPNSSAAEDHWLEALGSSTRPTRQAQRQVSTIAATLLSTRKMVRHIWSYRRQLRHCGKTAMVAAYSRCRNQPKKECRNHSVEALPESYSTVTWEATKHFGGPDETFRNSSPTNSKCVQLPPEPLHEPSTVTRPRHGPTKVVLRCVKFVWLRHHENAATGNLICRNPGAKFASSRCVCPFSVVAVTRAAHRPASFAAPALRLG